MPSGNRIALVAVSALVGGIVAVAACFVFYLFVVRQPSNVIAGPTPSPISTPPSETPTPDPEIPVSQVQAIELNTHYKGFFDEDQCVGPESPCRVVIRFERTATAKRTMFIKRPDKTVEKTVSTAPLAPEQFDAIAQIVVANKAVRSWRDGMTVYASNSSIRLEYNGVSKTVLSNVDGKTFVFLEMMNAIRRLDRSLSWKQTS